METAPMTINPVARKTPTTDQPGRGAVIGGTTSSYPRNRRAPVTAGESDVTYAVGRSSP